MPRGLKICSVLSPDSSQGYHGPDFNDAGKNLMGLLEKVTSQNKRSLALQNAKARHRTRDNAGKNGQPLSV
jgi:hypothetical protein